MICIYIYIYRFRSYIVTYIFFWLSHIVAFAAAQQRKINSEKGLYIYIYTFYVITTIYLIKTT